MTGQRLLHYEVVEKLGEGGMGVVYKARDTHLDRFVAVKVLPADKVADPTRKARFVQEAKAASALNHPNIITIYDISADAGTDFIAMEYVDGKTLDQIIPRNGMRLGEALKIAIQIADALARAHSAGIVHRDLKPANIMVDGHGQVKVLDFGLAKLTEVAADDRTVTMKTEEGAIVGTAAYMSPEQAEGRPVDARSDIFSFGAVLYEMVTGRVAFRGDSKMSTLGAIIHKEPEPLGSEVLADLAKIIGRCLRKDVARRFQHMDDIKVALEELKEESDSGRLTTGTAPVGKRGPPRTWVWAASGLAAALLAVSVAAWLGLFRRTPAAGLSKLSAFAAQSGFSWGPAISPDGKQIAFVRSAEQEDNHDIYVQLVDEATPRRLTTDPAFEYSPVWSPDSLRIAFLRDTPEGTEILMVPAAGGTERRLHRLKVRCLMGTRTMTRQFCGVDWSPDGQSLTFPDIESAQSPRSLFLLDIETRAIRKLTTPPAGSAGDGVSVFSPDGRWLAFARSRYFYQSDIHLLALRPGSKPEGEAHQLTSDNAMIAGLDWMPDGGSIVYSSARGGVQGLWQVDLNGGEPQRLNVGAENSYWPSVSRRGNRLAYTSSVMDSNIWRIRAPGAGGPEEAPVRLTTSPLPDVQPALSADGTKLAWTSGQSGSWEIWMSESDGSRPIRLTKLGQYSMRPQWAPDGRRLVFISPRGGTPQIYWVSTDGGPPRRLTGGAFPENYPSWSRDGQWVYFTSNRGGGTALWKASPQGGEPQVVAQQARRAALESHDGATVYYDGPDGQIWRIGTSGGEGSPVMKAPRRALWTLSRSGICLLDPDAAGGPELRTVPFAHGGRPEVRRLSGAPEDYATVGTLAMSPDGRWVFYNRLDRVTGDIMLVENFQ